MIKIRTKAQKAGRALLVGSLALVPILVASYFEWKKFCEQIFVRDDTLQCVFSGPLSLYFTPFIVAAIVFFILGIVLVLLPVIKKRF